MLLNLNLETYHIHEDFLYDLIKKLLLIYLLIPIDSLKPIKTRNESYHTK